MIEEGVAFKPNFDHSAHFFYFLMIYMQIAQSRLTCMQAPIRPEGLETVFSNPRLLGRN